MNQEFIEQAYKTIIDLPSSKYNEVSKKSFASKLRGMLYNMGEQNDPLSLINAIEKHTNISINTKRAYLKLLLLLSDYDTFILSETERQILEERVAKYELLSHEQSLNKEPIAEYTFDELISMLDNKFPVGSKQNTLVSFYLWYPLRDDAYFTVYHEGDDFRNEKDNFLVFDEELGVTMHHMKSKTIGKRYKPRTVELPTWLALRVRLMAEQEPSGTKLFNRKNTMTLRRIFQALKIDQKGGVVNFFRRWHKENTTSVEEEAKVILKSAHSAIISKVYGKGKHTKKCGEGCIAISEVNKLLQKGL